MNRPLIAVLSAAALAGVVPVIVPSAGIRPTVVEAALADAPSDCATDDTGLGGLDETGLGGPVDETPAPATGSDPGAASGTGADCPDDPGGGGPPADDPADDDTGLGSVDDSGLGAPVDETSTGATGGTGGTGDPGGAGVIDPTLADVPPDDATTDDTGLGGVDISGIGGSATTPTTPTTTTPTTTTPATTPPTGSGPPRGAAPRPPGSGAKPAPRPPRGLTYRGKRWPNAVSRRYLGRGRNKHGRYRRHRLRFRDGHREEWWLYTSGRAKGKWTGPHRARRGTRR